jgi:hypothetical protein
MTPRAERGGDAKRTEGKGVHMYAAVRRYEGITDPAEAGRLVGESFLPLLEHVSGFIAYYWIDAGEGVMASLSVYEDQAGADESVRIAHDWVRDNAATLIPNPPQVTEGQVVATDTA